MRPGWAPACMSAAELALWRVAAEAVYLERDARPCVDCPLSWARERRAEGICNGEPGTQANRASDQQVSGADHPEVAEWWTATAQG